MVLNKRADGIRGKGIFSRNCLGEPKVAGRMLETVQTVLNSMLAGMRAQLVKNVWDALIKRCSTGTLLVV